MTTNPVGQHSKTFVDLGDAGILERRIAIAYYEEDAAQSVVMTGEDGKVHPSLLPDQLVEPEKITTSVSLQAGDWVHIYYENGARQCNRATAETHWYQHAATNEAHGFVLEDYDAGTIADVYVSGTNTRCVPPDTYPPEAINTMAFLGKDAGSALTEFDVPTAFLLDAPPSGKDYVIQPLGRIVGNEVTAIHVAFNPGPSVRIFGPREATP
jgi:hypothetical protein